MKTAFAQANDLATWMGLRFSTGEVERLACHLDREGVGSEGRAREAARLAALGAGAIREVVGESGLDRVISRLAR